MEFAPCAGRDGCEYNRQSADSSAEHHQHKNQPRNRSELSCDAKAYADGSDGGSGFEQTGDQRKPLKPADDNAACHKHSQIQEENRNGIPDDGRRDPAVEHLRGILAAENSKGSCSKDGNGCGFHTAGSGSRGSADEHQEDHDKKSSLADLCIIDGVEAGGPHGHGLEQGAPDPLGKRHFRKFEKEEIQCRKKNKNSGDGEHRLRLHGAEAETEPVLPEVIPDRKAKAADDNEKHDGDVDHRICHIPAQ